MRLALPWVWRPCWGWGHHGPDGRGLLVAWHDHLVTTAKPISPRAGLLAICAAGVLWGTGGLAVQLIRERLPMSTLTVSAWRMALAALVLIITVVVGRHGPALWALMRARPKTAVFVGSCTAAYQALYFWAVTEAGVTIATVVSLGLAPVLLTLWDARRLRPSTRRVGVLIAALSGLVIVTVAASSSGVITGPHPMVGVLAACLSGASYAVATQVGRPLAAGHPAVVLTAVTTVAGTLVLTPLALLSGGPFVPADLPTWSILIYLGVFTMALAYGLLYAGLRTTTGSAAVIATLLEPVTAGVVAWLVLGERIGFLGVAGMLLILGAVAGLGEEAP